MSAGYSFEVDPSRDYVRLTMTGFFTQADMPAFLDARRAAHARLTCPLNAHVTLNDVRTLKIQSQDMVGAFSEMLSVPAYHARRLAFIVSPGLLRLQVVRLLASRASCFKSIVMAEAWLFSRVCVAP